MLNNSQVFMLLFLMLGPFKILGPFVHITKNADPVLSRKLALNAILFSIISLVLAAFLGENILSNYRIPVPILALSAGIILFLVALLGILTQFISTDKPEVKPGPPTMAEALHPLAFPTIVTPYGIAAVIVLTALRTELNDKLIVVAIAVGIMALNLIVMLFAKRLFKTLAVVLALLGAILGVIQVALGANIIYNSIKALQAS
jgi:multiple antibiotic resistance protein